MTVDKAINNAIASLNMEGYHIDDESIQHCKELLENKMTWEQYLDIVKEKIKPRSSNK
ncbi:MAG: antitoxin VbhA family protein [Oscillospiraceae bacterium]|nr:antitoxin VbhA family protein [Oscillospiraceae bacterium]